MEIDRSIFKSDKDNLDLEWEKQGQVSYDHSKALADAIEDRDTAKNHAEYLFAKTIGDAEDYPGNYGLTRITDSTLKYAARREPEYIEALKDLAKKEKLVNKLQGAVYALIQKRDSLEWLTKLYLTNYYAETELTDRVKERYGVRKSDEEHRKILSESPRLRTRRASKDVGDA